MIEILPIKNLTDEDGQIFGNLNVALAKLARFGISVADGIVITPPHLKLQTTLGYFDLGKKELFEQTLTLVKKEFENSPIPEILIKETGNHKLFLAGVEAKSVYKLWGMLLNVWLDQIRGRLWREGFSPNLTHNLQPQVVVFAKDIDSYGQAFINTVDREVIIEITKGKIIPEQMKNIDLMVNSANKKLILPFKYSWIIDGTPKFSEVFEYTPEIEEKIIKKESHEVIGLMDQDLKKVATKVFFDLSESLTVEKQVDGIFIDTGKTLNLEKIQESFDDLLFRLVESAKTYPNSPILVKLADIPEEIGGVRGSLRLLHQKSLFNMLCQAINFARVKKDLANVHIIVPFIRGTFELAQIKKELSVKGISRNTSCKIWMEIAVPENIINIDDYIINGIDGVVLNLDELMAHLNGFDHRLENMGLYKKELGGLMKFLSLGLKSIHKNRLPILIFGNLLSNTALVEFLVENGLYGVVVQRYESHSINDLLAQIEKKVIKKRSS